MIRSFAVLLATAVSLVAQQPTYHAVREAIVDQNVATVPGGFVWDIPGVRPDFIIAGGGQFTELPNGTARLTGRVFSASSVYSAFLFDIQLSGRVQPGDASYPPAGMPNLQLQGSAYVPTGTINPNTFVYYTQANGVLLGTREFDGYNLSIASSAPIQVGVGANNRNANLGVLGQFTVQVTHQLPYPILPSGTATLAIELPAEKEFFATHPLPDTTRTPLTAGRAMVMPGLGDDYAFVPSGRFTEHADGTATATGRLARLSHLDDAWQATISFQNRIDPGQVGYPPVGSPVLQLLPSAYVQNGGIIDPSHWRYYQNVTATLVGDGLNAGGSITLTNTIAAQIGGGSNQTNTYIGWYGAFAANITQQPQNRTIAVTGPVELFSTTAVFPVLPFPVLDVPATTPKLPTLTDQGLILSGDHFAWTEMFAVGWDLNGGHSKFDWQGGYFRVIDNQHIEVHPRPGREPGTYPIAIINPAIASNSINIELTAPTTPKLYTEDEIPPYWLANVYVHAGSLTGHAMTLVGFSLSNLPTSYPYIVDLGIGNNGFELIVDWRWIQNDPITGIAQVDYPNYPNWWGGLKWYMQAGVLDTSLPYVVLEPTNVFSVQFQ
ncbi:MAG: hypothetical protein U1F60_02250 [Planctomycetota bacterium]